MKHENMEKPEIRNSIFIKYNSRNEMENVFPQKVLGKQPHSQAWDQFIDEYGSYLASLSPNLAISI